MKTRSRGSNPRRMRRRDASTCLLDLGWDTESAGGTGAERYRATRTGAASGSQPVGFTTPWCMSWAEVLRHVDLTGKEEPSLLADVIEVRTNSDYPKDPDPEHHMTWDQHCKKTGHSPTSEWGYSFKSGWFDAMEGIDNVKSTLRTPVGYARGVREYHRVWKGSSGILGVLKRMTQSSNPHSRRATMARRKRRRRNPELLLVGNPLRIPGARMYSRRRRHRRNYPLTVKYRGRRRSFRGLVKMVRGIGRASAIFSRRQKYHGAKRIFTGLEMTRTRRRGLAGRRRHLARRIRRASKRWHRRTARRPWMKGLRKAWAMRRRAANPRRRRR